MFVDKPRPSVTYLLSVFIILLGLTIFFFFSSVIYAAIITFILFVFIFTGMYTVSYKVASDKLFISYGFLKSVINLKDIIDVKRVKIIYRVVGTNFAGSYGFCNRYTNGIVIKTKNRQYFLSPSDLEKFCLAIHCNA